MQQKVTAEQVHTDFNGYSDETLQQINNIINDDKLTREKEDLLKEFGFTQTTEHQKQERVINTKEEILLIKKYKKAYPEFKFITDRGIEVLCKKYNLVYGNVKDFKGFVPLKNLREMKAFKGINNKDKELVLSFDLTNGKSIFSVLSAAMANTINMASMVQPIQQFPYGGLVRGKKPDGVFIDELDNTIVESKPLSRNDWHVINNFEVVSEPEPELFKPILKICAPIHDMDTENKHLEGHFLVDDDPIILAPITGGALIITAWGDESEDPLIKD